MKLATILFSIILKAGLVECGLKSHAELIRQAIKVDNKIKDLVRKVTGFAKGNSEFKESYENLRIPLMENYTSLHSKLEHIREFEVYNRERLRLEQSIILTISKLNIPTSESCKKFYKSLRKNLVSKLTDTNIKKHEAIQNVKNITCQEGATLKTSPTSIKIPAVTTTTPTTNKQTPKITKTTTKPTKKFTELLGSRTTKITTTFSKFSSPPNKFSPKIEYR
ncbi:uncharacterized protein LOC108149210 isoform X2 [Drosophila elegans]|uniref:uncharacterized protein LOC108149210 isoform X2 n=1 Tax=Drosophila elegans TaxID=30023 RepID=UPI001BC85642|nr:uncharacterized protein LOC108149210 isoform X2 [Drosophila elegans]